MKKSTIRRNRLAIWVYLDTHPCVDCNESEKILLEFDHLIPKDKVDVISRMVRKVGMTKLFKEIAKCEVRCANCHRRKTAQDYTWYKEIDLQIERNENAYKK